MAVLTSSTTRQDKAWQIPPGINGLGKRSTTRRPGRWPYAAATFCWVVYSAAAIWMTEGLHLEINDSLARMADARAMLFSRDPHLAAIGLYWMPLPTVGQLPFMLVLSPLRHAELSGPLACAAVGALTVLVLAKICSVLQLATRLSVCLVLAYALNPIIVYTNGNGMSEAWSFLGCAIVLLGYITWSERHRTIDLSVLAGGLTVVMLVRYEAVLLAPVVASLAAVNDGAAPPTLQSLRAFVHDCRSRIRRWAATFAIVVLPTFFTLGLWCLMQYVLVRNPFQWYDQQKAQGHTTPSAYTTLPAHTAAGIVGFVTQMTLAIVPSIFIVVPLVILLRRRNADVLTGLGILVGALLWPFIVLMGLIANESSGVPRYFEPALVFVAVGAIWASAMATSISQPLLRRAVHLVLVVALIAGGLAGAVSLENPRRTAIEAENQFFDRVLGHSPPSLPPSALGSLEVWRTVAGDLDGQLASGSKVLADQSVDEDAYVFSRYPDRWIVNSDRDYLQIVSNPAGKFKYLLLASDIKKAIENATLQGILNNPQDGKWVKWKQYAVATVYRFEGTQGP